MLVTIVGVVIVSLEGTAKASNSTPKSGTNEEDMDLDLDTDIHQASSSTDSDNVCDHHIELIQDHVLPSSEEYTAAIKKDSSEQLVSAPASAVHVSYFESDLSRGYMLAVLNVGLDCMGSVLTKMYGDDFNTWEINLIRFGSASIVMGMMASAGRLFYMYGNSDQEGRMALPSSGGVVEGGESERRTAMEIMDFDLVTKTESKTKPDSLWFNMPLITMTRHRWMQVTTGVLFVTFLCPVLSIYALFTMDVALCLTLTSLGPLYSLPLVHVMKGEHVTLRGVGGTLLSCIGVVVLTVL